MGWEWSIEGAEEGNGSPGVARHYFTATGTADVELAGEVLPWLAEHGEFWDVLDPSRPFTVTVSPEHLPDSQ